MADTAGGGDTRPFPRPAITHDNAFFWEGVKAGKLLVRKCRACGRLHHPPGPMCPACHSLEWTTLQCSGRGTVHSFVIVHQPQIAHFKFPLPVALVDLEEGVRLVSNLPEVPAERLRIGMPVEVQFMEIEPDLVLPVFRERQP